MQSDRRYWFPAKRYGWGWGPPTSWQGWLVLIAYLALLIAGIVFVPPAKGVIAFIAYTTVVSLLLVAVCWMKGEPPRWRWGRD